MLTAYSWGQSYTWNIQPESHKFEKGKTLIEVVTGNWNGNSFKAYRNLAMVNNNYPDINIIVYHWGDYFELSDTRSYINGIGTLKVIPGAIVNRKGLDFKSTDNWLSMVKVAQKNDYPISFYFESGRGPDWSLYIKFEREIKNSKLMILLVEDPISEIILENPYPYVSTMDYFISEDKILTTDIPSVLRDFILPPEGVSLTFPEGWSPILTVKYNFNVTLSPDWDKNNISIVAFIFDQNQVYGSIKTPLFSKD